jgi:allophanate hydrolase/aspartyl-tRNA(Asn)/glutamyl-tRNA(Gln) amidotransferase subunit A
MLSFDIKSLRQAYAGRSVTPSQVVEEIYDRIEVRGADGVWISVVPRERALQRARDLEASDQATREKLALFGLPFSVKDCIDVADMPTTAGCPDFVYTAEKTNLAVARALGAGAILIGKTNLDQFATGLVGVRTPYGVAVNPFGSDLIPGGSSSGAAVSVSAGLVSFAFGTDTGGSGRIPAGFNNIVGLKPTLGLLSRTDMTNACRTLDTVSIFALTAPDALEVLNICAARDPDDAYARTVPDARRPAYRNHVPFTFAVPQEDQRQFFGNDGAAALYKEAIAELTRMGGEEVSIDYSPFVEMNDFMFNGPWLAERLVSVGPFIYEKPDALHPVTRKIILGAEKYSVGDLVEGFYRLKELHNHISGLLDGVDVVVVPTAGTIHRISEVEADPITLNSNMGYYTNFVNFLDLAAIAVPNGFLADGAPMGITLIGPAFSDSYLAGLAGAFHGRRVDRLGATDFPIPELVEGELAAR